MPVNIEVSVGPNFVGLLKITRLNRAEWPKPDDIFDYKWKLTLSEQIIESTEENQVQHRFGDSIWVLIGKVMHEIEKIIE